MSKDIVSIRLRNNRVCFSIYRHLFRNRLEFELSSASTELCIEGTPSSGNTLARLAFLNAVPSMQVSSHYHNIPNVYRSLKYCVPTVILIRKPLDVLSSVVVREIRSIDAAILEYLIFYGSILRFQKHGMPFELINFDDLISSMTDVIEGVLKNLKILNKSGTVNSVDLMDKLIKNDKERMNSSLRSGVPSVQKEKEKVRARDLLISHRKFPNCEVLFNRLISGEY